MHTLHIGKLVRRFYFKTKFGGYNNLHFKLSFIKVYFLAVQIPVIFFTNSVGQRENCNNQNMALV